MEITELSKTKLSYEGNEFLMCFSKKKRGKRKMKKNNSEFTPNEREFIDNFCKDGKSDKHFGQLQVKEYLGNLNTLKALNGTAKNIGTIQFLKTDDCWYFITNDNKKYRYPEKLVETYVDGIESLFKMEFKRVDA